MYVTTVVVRHGADSAERRHISHSFYSGASYLREAVDGGLAGAVSRVVMEGEEGSSARRTDDLAPGAALDHPLRALLGQDERRPHVHLKQRKRCHSPASSQNTSTAEIGSKKGFSIC